MMHEENFCCSCNPVHRDPARGMYIPASSTSGYPSTDTSANKNGPLERGPSLIWERLLVF